MTAIVMTVLVVLAIVRIESLKTDLSHAENALEKMKVQNEKLSKLNTRLESSNTIRKEILRKNGLDWLEELDKLEAHDKWE